MATTQQVQQLYIGLLGRAADQAGLNFWINDIASGHRTLADVQTAFAASPEFQASYGSIASREALVTAIYTNLFERAPDAAGLAYWVGTDLTADQLIAGFLQYASPADQLVINNKVTVAQYYTEAAGVDVNLAAATAIIADVDGTAASVSTALTKLPATNSATFNAAVVKLLEADKAVDANIKAWGVANSDTTPTSAEIYGKLEAAEAKIATAAADANLGIDVATQTALNAVEAANYTGYNSADATEAQALIIARAQIATKKLALDGNLTAATNALEAVSSADVLGSLKALIDSYQTKLTAAASAQTLENAAGVAVAGKVAEASIVLDNAVAPSTDFTVTSASAGVVRIVETGAFGNYEATYNATTNAWSYAKYDGAAYTALSAGDAAADVNLQKLLANANAKSVFDAASAHAEAVAVTDAAEAAVIAELAKIETVDGTLTAAATPGAAVFSTALTGAALTYQNAVKALADHATAKTAFDNAVSGADAVRAEAATLAGLEKAAADARAVVEAVVDVKAIGDAATAADDLFIFSGTGGTTANFGVDGSDKIFFGTGYSLVNFAAGQTTASNLGSSSALEIFYDKANATLWVEKQAFGGNSAGTADLVEIVLTGASNGVALSADGYLTVVA